MRPPQTPTVTKSLFANYLSNHKGRYHSRLLRILPGENGMHGSDLESLRALDQTGGLPKMRRIQKGYPRIDDKWGQAGCIKVSGGWEPLRLSILWVGFNIKVHGWIVGTQERNYLI